MEGWASIGKRRAKDVTGPKMDHLCQDSIQHTVSGRGLEEPQASLLSRCHIPSASSQLRRHQENVAGVADQLVRDYRSPINNREPITLVEPDRFLILLEDQKA